MLRYIKNVSFAAASVLVHALAGASYSAQAQNAGSNSLTDTVRSAEGIYCGIECSNTAHKRGRTNAMRQLPRLATIGMGSISPLAMLKLANIERSLERRLDHPIYCRSSWRGKYISPPPTYFSDRLLLHALADQELGAAAAMSREKKPEVSAAFAASVVLTAFAASGGTYLLSSSPRIDFSADGKRSWPEPACDESSTISENNKR